MTTQNNSKKKSISIDDIKAEAESLGQAEPIPNAFVSKTANQWLEEAKKRPAPVKLYDEFWCEGELCFLFADSGVGKSILAVQIGDHISRGLGSGKAQKVSYFDFELSMKQFEKRYCKVTKEGNDEIRSDHYVFHENFKRLEINIDAEMPERFKDLDEWVNFSFEQAVVTGDAKVIIVDNITYMRDELEKSHIASSMMKMLNHLKKKFGLSILALAHTPKRDNTKPLSSNDLGGSKMLVNFADSCFAIGKSNNDENIRYIRQIKVRDSEHKYTKDNVKVYQISKNSNFLGFEHIGYSPESDHLKILSEKEKADLPQRIKNLSEMGLSQREIASRCQVSVGTVNRYLKMNESNESDEREPQDF
jgi:RecA-family ATPase